MQNFFILFIALFITACSSSYKIYTEGEYLNDPREQVLLNDALNEKDYEIITTKVAKDVKKCLENEEKYVSFDHIQNYTDDHLDIRMMSSQLKNKFNIEKMKIVDSESRVIANNEYENIEQYTQGKIVKDYAGFNYVLKGNVHANKQSNSKNKVVYYYANFDVVDLNSSLVKCNTFVEIKKVFKSKAF